MKRQKKTQRRHRRGRILLVENDRVVLEAVADMLAVMGYEVTKAKDGLEALKLFRKKPFDAAILDIVLPKIDGHDLCRLIRQDERGRLLPIIAFTALAPQDVEKLPGLSADAYVAKGPLTVIIPNILDAIKSVLTSRPGRLRRERIFGYQGFHPRRIVDELFELKRYYQRLVHAVAEVVIELDTHGSVLSANPAALRLVGRPEAEVRGLAFAHLLKPRDQTAFQNFLAQVRQDPLEARIVIEVILAASRQPLQCRPVLDAAEIIAFLVTG
jgi:CheY-like chemotaxis protein